MVKENLKPNIIFLYFLILQRWTSKRSLWRSARCRGKYLWKLSVDAFNLKHDEARFKKKSYLRIQEAIFVLSFLSHQNSWHLWHFGFMLTLDKIQPSWSQIFKINIFMNFFIHFFWINLCVFSLAFVSGPRCRFENE